PTWANHTPLLAGSGLRLERYPYFDPPTGGGQFGAHTAALDPPPPPGGGVRSGAWPPARERLPPRAVVLLPPPCHNPTGADLSAQEWRTLLALVKRRQLLPFIDMAYQGLGQG